MFRNNLFDFEKIEKDHFAQKTISADEESINKKYEEGLSRVVTESGSYKVSLLKDIFSSDEYDLKPDYQRRITWNNAKRSKLIESLIMNIPIPPVFLYEKDFNKYEIMDGLQRISAIIAFYNNEYALTGLTEWKELNGKRYKNLPIKIKEGIDRRQILFTTLLKETASDPKQADKIKRMVFERLNTGGVKLTGQEIRNALYNGPGNEMCKKLSEYELFRKLWDIPKPDTVDFDIFEFSGYSDDAFYTDKQRKKLERHSLYKRMYDVELVLRFFAMRHIEEFNISLIDFLDTNLINLNTYTENELDVLKENFKAALDKADKLFGEYAFRFYKDNEWTSPARLVYDPMLYVLSGNDVDCRGSLSERIEMLQTFYSKHEKEFDGKHQTKDDITNRIDLLFEFLRENGLI